MAGPDPFHKSGDEVETPVAKIDFPDEGDVAATHADGTTADDHPDDNDANEVAKAEADAADADEAKANESGTEAIEDDFKDENDG